MVKKGVASLRPFLTIKISLNVYTLNYNVTLHVHVFFKLHLLSNDIKLHTNFQTKLNPIENCTRIFFTLYRV